MITVSRARSMVLALLAAVGIAAQAAPTAVFDTLGPGNVYQAGTGWAVGSVGNGSNYVTADRFVANAGGALDTASPVCEGLRIVGSGHPRNLGVFPCKRPITPRRL